MRKHEEVIAPQSCLNRARDDEWLFVLLGRDVAAPAAVRAWIEERVRLGKNAITDAQIVESLKWIETVKAEQRRMSERTGVLHVIGAVEEESRNRNKEKWE